MSDEELFFEIIKILHKNGDSMLSDNLRKESGLDYIDFLSCLSNLKELGYVKAGHSSQKKYSRYIYLTDEGKSLVS